MAAKGCSRSAWTGCCYALEKGFLHVGSDTDGTTVPDDVGWGRVASSKKQDYIGKRSLILPEHLRADRLQLVGLVSATDIVIGSHLRLADTREATDGWVTSAGRAVLSGEPIALACFVAEDDALAPRSMCTMCTT